MSYRGGVGCIMQGWGEVGHVGVGWVCHAGVGGVCHTGVGCVL